MFLSVNRYYKGSMEFAGLSFLPGLPDRTNA